MSISKKIILFLLFFMTIFACNRVPKDILSERKMIRVLTDMATTSGSMSVSDYRNHEYEKKEQYYKSIFEKHHITPAQVDSSLMWYAKDPKKLELIYETVGINLEKRVADLEKEEQKEE